MNSPSTSNMEEIAKLVTLVVNHLEKKYKPAGTNAYVSSATSFIACFVGAIVYQVLKDPPPVKSPTKGEAHAHAYKGLVDIKKSVSDATASGFTGALSTWSGKDVEYYCQIKVVPEPVNERPC